MEVMRFYADLPFNYYSSTDIAATQILNNSIEAAYPDLHALLAGGAVSQVFEFGCGAGWLSNSIALHYGQAVTGIDFTAKAVVRAREVAEYLEIENPPSFVEADLFEVRLDRPADLAVSIGVLHHTADAKRAFQRIAGFVTEGGYLYIGLYHRYGRQEFLRMFQEIMESQGEQAALESYARLTRMRPQDRTYLASWFRDQVLHPHESLHTLAETCQWLEEMGLTLRSTSINRFAPITSLPELFEAEKEYAAVSYRANREEGRYFPGFFTFLAQKA